ncbi:MAG: general glycosylation pathway protein [Gammaproteobacteria bacterium]|nr:general glycosylation pathway protein [Gammaproteobacteria bacterium]
MNTSNRIHRLFFILTRFIYIIISITLLLVSITMIGVAIWQILHAFNESRPLVTTLLDSVGLSIIAIAVFDVVKYLMEEEVLRDRELRSPTEARRTLTKFLVIICIAVSLESLVFIFGAGRTHVDLLIYPTVLLAVAVLLIVGLGLYQKLSLDAEHDKS